MNRKENYQTNNARPTNYGSFSLVIIMFLLALIELKKPKDAGLRIIFEYANDIQTLWRETMLMVIGRRAYIRKILIKKIVDVIFFLPNLEA